MPGKNPNRTPYRDVYDSVTRPVRRAVNKASGTKRNLFGVGGVADGDEVKRVLTSIMRGRIEPWVGRAAPPSNILLACALEAAKQLAKIHGLFQRPAENEIERMRKAMLYNEMIDQTFAELRARGENVTRQQVLEHVLLYVEKTDPEIRSLLVQ